MAVRRPARVAGDAHRHHGEAGLPVGGGDPGRVGAVLAAAAATAFSSTSSDLRANRLDHRRVVLDGGAVAHGVVHGAGGLGRAARPRPRTAAAAGPAAGSRLADRRCARGLHRKVHDDHAAVDRDHPVLRGGRDA